MIFEVYPVTCHNPLRYLYEQEIRLLYPKVHPYNKEKVNKIASFKTYYGIPQLIITFKDRSIYWGKIAQGPMQIFPIWDNSQVLPSKNGPLGMAFGITLFFQC